MCVPTIEFSDYADAFLELTGHRSLNPSYTTHFVNRDADAFRRTLAAVMGGATRPAPAPALEDDSGIIRRLAFGARAGRMASPETATRGIEEAQRRRHAS